MTTTRQISQILGAGTATAFEIFIALQERGYTGEYRNACKTIMRLKAAGTLKVIGKGDRSGPGRRPYVYQLSEVADATSH